MFGFLAHHEHLSSRISTFEKKEMCGNEDTWKSPKRYVWRKSSQYPYNFLADFGHSYPNKSGNLIFGWFYPDYVNIPSKNPKKSSKILDLFKIVSRSRISIKSLLGLLIAFDFFPSIRCRPRPGLFWFYKSFFDNDVYGDDPHEGIYLVFGSRLPSLTGREL